MHFNIQVKIVLTIILPLIYLAFSASSCDNYKTGSDYKSIAYNDAVNAGIPTSLFVKQIDIESHFNPNAYSSQGAEGIAQFMPTTAQGLGIDPWNPEQSLQGAAQLMARYINKYGDYRMALAAYNCGSGCLQNAIDNYGYWFWGVPSATRTYSVEVMGS